MIVAGEVQAKSGTIGRTIMESARLWPDRRAFVMDDREASYKEFHREVEACARNLLRNGVAAGDYVGILMPNCWNYAILVNAANLIGASAVVLNARYRGEDLAYVMKHARISVLFITGMARPHLDLHALLCATFPGLAEWRKDQPLRLDDCPMLRKVFYFDAPDEEHWPTDADFEKSTGEIAEAALAERISSVNPGDTALIIFSSGTTAQPKACMISHESISLIGKAIAERLEITQEDVFWDPLPFYHLSSYLPFMACRLVGATFVSQRHFEPGVALREMERVKATICYPAFPALTAGLIDHPDFKTTDLSSLRIQLNIGAPDQLAKFAKAIPQATQICCYGLTECGGIATMSSPSDTLEQRTMSAGKPLSTHSVRIVDPASLEELAQGERGEIVVKGPNFSGYFGDSAQTALAMMPDGWLRTGDLGWVDADGYLVYSGRLKDMLKIGGENVAAVEVESFLSRHPKIKMAQVISAPDDRLVEVVAAFIEVNAGEKLTEDEVIRYCVGAIASYKIPRFVRFVTEWPMSATKIQKRQLAESFDPYHKIDVSAYLR